jgi:hypothetical protein
MADLSSREATLVVERKDLEETHAGVLARELATDIRDVRLNSREEELADRERRLVKRYLQDLATACRRLEELHVAQEGKV